MIRLTASGKIHYQMLNQIVLLLVVYACLMLLTAIQTIPVVAFIPTLHFNQWADRVLHLTLLTGMVTAGMTMCRVDESIIPYQRWLYRLWWVLIVATILGGGLEHASRLDVVAGLLLFAYLGISAYSKMLSPFVRVWQIGIVFIISSLLAQFVVHDHWEAIVKLFRVYVGYGVVGVSILFWLMTRWSHVREVWAQDGVYIVASLIALSGLLISFAPLGFHPWIGIISALLIPISFMILAGHSYRALKDRNQNQSLSPHWIAVAVLFWLTGGGFLGTVSTQGQLHIWIHGTQLAQTQLGWMLWGLLAIMLGLVNYQATALRGENRRVTGYMPLWLIAFGSGFALMIQASIGVVEIYLLKMIHLAQTHLDVLIVPLQMMRIVCLLAAAVGITIYALGYWVRRPKRITVIR